MAHIWVSDASQWAILPLDHALFSLRARGPLALQSGMSVDWEEGVTLMPSTGPAGESWLLLAGAHTDVRINGIRLNVGVCSLRDRDEIRIADAGLFYFSTERLAVIEPFPGSVSAAFCPRCRQAIESGHPSVKCPACGVWYHESKSNDLPCWTYSETCALCPQITSMDSGYRWTPEEI